MNSKKLEKIKHSKKPLPEGSLGVLVERSTEYLRAHGYAKRTIKAYSGRWHTFQRFCWEKFRSVEFSRDHVEPFLRFWGIESGKPSPPLKGGKRLTRGAMRALTELALHGSFVRNPPRAPRETFPPFWEKLYEGYSEHLVKEAGLKPQTAYVTKSHIRQFFCFLRDQGVKDAKGLRPTTAVDFLGGRIQLMRSTLHRVARDLHALLRYMYVEGMTTTDMSVYVPRLPSDWQAHLPQVWTAEEVEQLLAVVDRASPAGKRNYAILLLAARLGMRIGDIKRLTFDNLRWTEGRIEMTQSKTGEPLVLPLPEEVGWAIIEYLKNGRPVSEFREIFLACNAPFAPLGYNHNLGGIITRYRRLAKIPLQTGRKLGIHALRHAVASRLLESGASIRTVAEILGHSNPESTKSYARIDINTLRRAALEIEEA